MGTYTHRRSGIGYFRCGSCRNGDVNTSKLWESVRDWLLICVQSSDAFAGLVENGIEAPETIDQVKKQVDADLTEIEEIDESITRAMRMGARLSRYEDRVHDIIQELETRQTRLKEDLAGRQIFLDDLMEKEAIVRISRIFS